MRILLAVGDIPTLSADASGQFLYDYLRSKGHTVTLIDDASPAPATINIDYDLIFFANSCPAAMNLATLGYDASTVPKVATGVRSPHTNFAAVAPTSSVVQNTIYIKAAGVGHPVVPSDITVEQTIQIQDNTFASRYVLNTSFGVGRVEIASRISTALNNLSYVVYDTGAAMAVGNAPVRLAWYMHHPGSIGNNIRGKQMIDYMIYWAAGIAMPTEGPTVSTSKNDDIVSELKAAGHTGTIDDMERQRLLAELVLVEPQNLSLQDLYSLAGERPRVF